MECFGQKPNCLICIDWKRITLLIRLTTVPVRQSHTIVSSLLWTLQAFILNLSPALEESAGHTVPVPLEKCRIFLEKNGEKWPALRKITAAKSHDFVAAGTPGRIWTSDPSLRRRMLYPTELRGQMAIFYYFAEYSELFYRFLFSVIPDSAEFHFRQKSSDFHGFRFPDFFKRW